MVRGVPGLVHGPCKAVFQRKTASLWMKRSIDVTGLFKAEMIKLKASNQWSISERKQAWCLMSCTFPLWCDTFSICFVSVFSLVSWHSTFIIWVGWGIYGNSFSLAQLPTLGVFHTSFMSRLRKTNMYRMHSISKQQPSSHVSWAIKGSSPISSCGTSRTKNGSLKHSAKVNKISEVF